MHSDSPNIHVRKSSLEEIRVRTQDVMHCSVALNNPYKLCDLRPLYGILFEQEVQNYDFWGYCDCDLIFGDIRSFVTEDVLDSHNSILGLGHFHLQRTKDQLYQKVLDDSRTRDGLTLREVLSSDTNYGFDEMPYGVTAEYYRQHPDLSWTGFSKTGRCYSSPTNQNPLFEDMYNNYALYNKSFYHALSHKFPCWKRAPTPRLKWSVYLKDGIKLYAVGVRNGRVIEREEILYAHFIQRKLKLECNDMEHYIVVPNTIIETRTIDWCFLWRMSHRLAPYWIYFKQRLGIK